MSIKTNSLFIFFLCFLSFDGSVNAQTFRFGAVSGLNFSSQNPKNTVEYGGFNFGGKVAFDVHKKFRTSMDIQFNRKINAEELRLEMDYIEVPLMLTFTDWMDSPNEEEYYRLHFTAGVSFGELVRYNALNDFEEDVTNSQSFNKRTINAIGGLVYYFNEHFGLNLQYHHGYFNFQKDNGKDMKHRHWSFNLIYMHDNKRRR